MLLYNWSYPTFKPNFKIQMEKVFTLYMLGNFSCFCCYLLTFLKINVFTKILKEMAFNKIPTRVSNDLDPDQDRRVLKCLYLFVWCSVSTSLCVVVSLLLCVL